MWGNKRRTLSLILKILAGLLAVLLAFGIYKAYRNQLAKDAAEKHEYSAVYEEHTQNEVEAKQAYNDLIDAEYEKDTECVRVNLPGIVCWGDTLTVGTTGGVSYPSVLQDLINTNICDAYNFRAQMEKLGDFSSSRVVWSDYKVMIPVVNMGVYGESAPTIAGRSGAMPYLLSRSVAIPEDCTAVQVSLTCAVGQAVNPLESGESGINDVSIAGVTGKLSRVRAGLYMFTRNEPGDPVLAEAGTEVITACSDMYTDFIPVILIGTYGGYSSPEEYIEMIRSMIDHHHTETGRYLIIGPFTSSASTSGNRFAALEQALQQAFGDNFINARKYFCSDAMSDAKLSYTKADQQEVSRGTVPGSLRNPLAPEELTATGYELLGKLIYTRMDQLGWFDEVREELGINAQ